MPSLKLPSMFSDHAVLQHSRQIPIWGWTEPGTPLTIAFRDQLVTTTAGPDGRFDTHFNSLAPGGPFEIVIQCGEEQTTLHDVLVGEVWLASGQSNMEWPLRESADADAHIAQAKHNRIRLLQIPQTAAETPSPDVQAQWANCTPETAANFSAVAFFFGKHLHQNLDVPVGLIQSAWGGTTCEAWTSRETLEADPALAQYARKPDAPVGPHQDPGISAEASSWMAPDLDQSDWRTMKLPQAWEFTGMNIDGAVWFRRTVQIPSHWVGQDLLLSLDSLDDFDHTFVNGQQVGHTGLETPNCWAFPRKYVIPAALVTSERLVIATRIFDQWGDGGFTGKPENLYLAPHHKLDERLSLAGDWLYRVELELEPRFPASAVAPMSLYNGMIAPLLPFPIAGAIWYQGESNVDRAFEYRRLFPAMINCWRNAWKDPFPFLFVLLAGWHAHPLEPGESQIAELRDAQLSALSLPATGAASAIDLGDIEDIHPRNKHDVGHRLALVALATHYGRDLEYSGPVLQNTEPLPNGARLSFSHADGLHARGGAPRGFTVAGDDGVFEWASMGVDGNTVIALHPRNLPVKCVRYNWSDNPLGNLYNSAGLPMLPFRTDNRSYTTAPDSEEYGRLG